MVNRIHKLSNQLANQIAAGEVVERPASIVKELVENSLDAGASCIQIFIEQGGLSCIKIQDNGSGITQEDLPLAIAPHATSKISQVQDLECIESLGFRGEALASISAVSRFKLISKPKEQAYAYEISLEGKEASPQQVVSAYPDGTTVIVRDLFFNVPARRKFLKNAQTEFLHIEDTVKRLALSYFEVEFCLYHNQKLIFKLPKADNETLKQLRLGKLFNQACLPTLRALDFEHCGAKLQGWFSDLNYTRSQADWQYIFVNGRMVRDRLLNHAIRQAYQSKIYPGRQPIFVLYLTLPGDQVDVNVHPTKHEVRFREQRFIHDFIISCLQQVLAEEFSIPMQFEAVKIKEPGTNTELYWQNKIESEIARNTPLTVKQKGLLVENKWLLWPKENKVYAILLESIFEHWVKKKLTEHQSTKLLLYPWVFDLLATDFLRVKEVLTVLGCQAILDDSQVKITHLPMEIHPVYTQDNVKKLIEKVTSENSPVLTIVKNWLNQLDSISLWSFLESQEELITKLAESEGLLLKAAHFGSSI